MLRKQNMAFIVLLFVCLMLAACGSNASKTKEKGSEEPKTETTDESKKEEKEENAIPDDDELISVIESSLQAFEDKDVDEYLKTIHSESPAINSTKATLEQLKPFSFKVELSDLKVEEKTEKEAKIKFTQKTIATDGGMPSSQVKGIHVLRLDNDGKWKIYTTEPEETLLLDENGDPIENETGATVLASIEGDYAKDIQQLELPFGDIPLQLNNYQEEQDYATAEILMQDDRYQEVLFTIEFIKDVADTDIDAGQWVENMEEQISADTNGESDFKQFDVTAKEAMYYVTVPGMPAQAEVSRGFFKDDDFVMVSFTVMQQEINEEALDEWTKLLKKIN